MVCDASSECMCRALPSSLLLLSRAFTVTQPLESPSEDAPFDSLKETISSLPNKVWHPPVQLAGPLQQWDMQDSGRQLLTLLKYHNRITGCGHGPAQVIVMQQFFLSFHVSYAGHC